MHHFFYSVVICFGGHFLAHTLFFSKSFFGFFMGILKNNFWVFLSVPHLVDNYAKIVDERGQNLMCGRTLPSLLVLYFSKVF